MSNVNSNKPNNKKEDHDTNREIIKSRVANRMTPSQDKIANAILAKKKATTKL